MKIPQLLLGSMIIGLQLVQAQTPTTKIATWKNDAKGAYNIIHDDFGDLGVIGIQNYADTMHFNRGLKFTFGAITSACEGNAGMYDDAKDLISHGHEIINHSHTHSCAVGSQNCGGTGQYYQWAETGKTNAFNIEVDYSHNSIKNNTGYTPRFFIFPYDQFNANANTYLQNKGYLGSRTGAYNSSASNNFAPNSAGFYETPLVVDVLTTNGVTKAVNLNDWVDDAIANGVWVNRELHNIGDNGWGSVDVATYRDHLNYVKSKVQSGDLWVGTISEILTYQIQKLNYTPSTTYNSTSKVISITWNTPTFNVANYLANLQVKSPITLSVDLKGLLSSTYTITQGVKTISNKTVKNGILYFDCYPHEGNISIQLQSCPTVCLIEQPLSQTVFQGGNNVTFSVSAISDLGAVSYQWFKNGNIINGATTSKYVINTVQYSDSGNYTVKVTAGVNNITSNTAKLTVKKRPSLSPYFGVAAQIPGKIESEYFDLGGPDTAYHDVDKINEGDNNLRQADAPGVDLEICNDGVNCANIGYNQTGEWYKYTVDVTQTQDYNITIRYANNAANPKVKLYLNDTAITSSISFPSTGDWGLFKNVTVKNVNLKAGNNKVLKVAITADWVNLNHITFAPSVITSMQDDYVTVAKLTALPNPSDGVLNLEGLEKGSLEILNVSGEVIKVIDIQEGVSKLTIDEKLVSGIYFIRNTSDDQIQVIRFVKL